MKSDNTGTRTIEEIAHWQCKESDAGKNFILKEFSEIKDKMLEADSELERSATVYKAKEKMPTLYPELNTSKASTVHAALNKFSFSQRNKNTSQCFQCYKFAIFHL